MARRRHESKLEVALWIRAPGGGIEAEYIIRGGSVDVRNYFPSGELIRQRCAVISLADFEKGVEAIRAGRAPTGGNRDD